jgi:hypothetical protein
MKMLQLLLILGACSACAHRTHFSQQDPDGMTTVRQSESLLGAGRSDSFWNFDTGVNVKGDWHMRIGGGSADDLKENVPLWQEALKLAAIFAGGFYAGGGVIP